MLGEIFWEEAEEEAEKRIIFFEKPLPCVAADQPVAAPGFFYVLSTATGQGTILH